MSAVSHETFSQKGEPTMPRKTGDKSLNIIYTGTKVLEDHHAIHEHIRLENRAGKLVERTRDNNLTDTTLRWLGDQPDSVPDIAVSVAPPEVFIREGVGTGQEDQFNLTMDTLITLGLKHEEWYSNDTRFTWQLNDSLGNNLITTTGLLFPLVAPSGGVEYTLSVTASNPRLDSTTVKYKLIGRGNGRMPVPTFEDKQHFKGLGGDVIEWVPSNLASLKNITGCLIHYKIGSTVVVSAPETPFSFTFPAGTIGNYPLTTEIKVFITGTLYGKPNVSDITTLQCDTVDPAITGKIVITPEHPLGVLNTTIAATFGGVSSPSGSMTFSITGISDLLLITPTTGISPGQEVLITTGIEASRIGSIQSFDVTATDGVESMTQTFNQRVTPATALNIDSITRVLLSGVENKSPSTSTVRYGNATTDSSNPITYQYLRSIDSQGHSVRGVHFEPSTWGQGESTMITLEGTPYGQLTHLLRISDGLTVYDHSEVVDITPAIVDISELSKVRTGGETPCGVDSVATYRIGGATSPSGKPVEYNVAYHSYEYLAIEPVTWAEGDEILITMSPTAVIGVDAKLQIEVTSDGVEPATKEFTCTIGIPDVTSPPLIETILVSELAHIANPVVIHYGGVSNETVTEPVKMRIVGASPGMVISPMQWVQGANIAITVDLNTPVGTALEYTVEAYTDQYGSDQLMVTKRVQFTALA
jgi:hypothetical protein